MATQNLHYKNYYTVKTIKLHKEKTMTICTITQTKQKQRIRKEQLSATSQTYKLDNNSERVPGKLTN